MKPIRLLEFCDLRTTSWLRRPRSLRQNYSKSEPSWKGLQVQSLMRCLIFRNLLPIESVQGMIASTSTTVFVLPANNIETENNVVKNNQLVRTQTRVNIFQEHPLSLIRKRLKTLKLRRLTLKTLNKRSGIFVITVEQPIILDLIAIIGQSLNRATA